jgi:hypothetical protein
VTVAFLSCYDRASCRDSSTTTCACWFVSFMHNSFKKFMAFFKFAPHVAYATVTCGCATVTYGCAIVSKSTCSATCGPSGTQTTTQQCVAYTGVASVGTPVSDASSISACAGCTTTTMPCPALPTCASYVCVTLGTSNCMNTCGAAGVQTTTRYCAHSDHTEVNGAGSRVNMASVNCETNNPIHPCCSCTSSTNPCPNLPACLPGESLCLKWSSEKKNTRLHAAMTHTCMLHTNTASMVGCAHACVP